MDKKVQPELPSQEVRERPLLSAEVKQFQSRKDFSLTQLVVTKTRIMLARDDAILRTIKLSQIDAITISTLSPEFVLHVRDDADERFACTRRKQDIVEMIVYLRSHFSSCLDQGSKTRLYLVEDLTLDVYVTTEEDLDDGHLIRPDKENLHLMDYEELIEYQREQERQITEERRQSHSLLSCLKQTVTIEDFDLLMLLGKGAHGKVLLAERRQSPGQFFAIKILRKQHILDTKQLEHTISEMAVLSQLNHPFLVPLRHAFSTESKIYFVLDFMRGGELFQHMKRLGRFPEDQARFICACLVLAIGRLHSAGYVYRDLKPENVLLDEEGFARLTDFGLSKLLKDDELATTFCGTPEYMAPEVILRKGCTHPADWWSLGVLTYEMLFGGPPFYSEDVQQMYKKTLGDQLRFPAKSGVSKPAMDFCAGLLTKSWNRRLGSIADSLEIMNHPWFAEFEWSKLLARKLQPPFQPQTKKWEKNFDPQFVEQEPRDSKCEVNPENLKNFEKEFSLFHFQEEQDNKRGSQTSTRGFLLARAFRENLKNESQTVLVDGIENSDSDSDTDAQTGQPDLGKAPLSKEKPSETAVKDPATRPNPKPKANLFNERFVPVKKASQ